MDNPFQKLFDRYLTNEVARQQVIDKLSIHLRTDNFKKKHILIRENQTHEFAYFIVQGAARCYYLKDGTEVHTWFAFENDMVGSLHNFKGAASRETIELVEDSTIITINFGKLKPLMTSDVGVANFVYAIVEEYALFLEEKIQHAQLTTSMDRYLSLLEHEPQIFQRIPLTYIASYLGISRETLSRLRAR